MARRASIGSVSFFFQPLQIHLESSDLLIEFGLEGFVLSQLLGGRRTKNRGSLVQQLTFPLANLARMHSMLAGELIYRLIVLDGFHRYLKLELGGMPLTLN
jgi:hypothetical protein